VEVCSQAVFVDVWIYINVYMYVCIKGSDRDCICEKLSLDRCLSLPSIPVSYIARGIYFSCFHSHQAIRRVGSFVSLSLCYEIGFSKESSFSGEGGYAIGMSHTITFTKEIHSTLIG